MLAPAWHAPLNAIAQPPHPPLQVVPSSFEETLPKDSVTAAEYARLTALHKAQDVARSLAAASSSGQQPPVLIIGADTVVEYGEHILEKPAGALCSRKKRVGQQHVERPTRCAAVAADKPNAGLRLGHLVHTPPGLRTVPPPHCVQMPQMRSVCWRCSAGSGITCTLV